MGSINVQPTYSVPEETHKVLVKGIFGNSKITRNLPAGTGDFASKVCFEGNDLPSIPINWRFAESAASLKGLEACVVAEFVRQKYGVELSGATINTDHAQLFFMSTLLWSVVGEDEAFELFKPTSAKMDKLIPSYDIHKMSSSMYKLAATNIYETKDKKYFHLHGSMNPGPSLEMLGLPKDGPGDTWPEAMKPAMQRVAEMDSHEIQGLASDVYKQAGVVCNTLEEFRNSEHGKANEHVGLFEVHDVPMKGHEPCWWPDSPQTSAERPLAGLKVVDLTRIIAAPAVTRGLAELGASVMRVTCPYLSDLHQLHMDLNWGKWNASLDLKKEEDKETLRNLIREADVVLQGYRPGVLDKYGFGQQGIIDLVKDRKRGIISARENCYGWNGPWYYRSGWQQISDACVGISARFGERMGLKNNEAVTPVFPNSDYMTGIAGVCGILVALMRRAEKGGSYKVDLALNYYNQWLAESCGEYPEDVWQDVWKRNGGEVFRCYHNMNQTIPKFMKMLRENSANIVLNEKFFEERETKALGVTVKSVKPIVRYGDDQVRPGFNVGARGNGKDVARWPEDLMTEVVT